MEFLLINELAIFEFGFVYYACLLLQAGIFVLRMVHICILVHRKVCEPVHLALSTVSIRPTHLSSFALSV